MGTLVPIQMIHPGQRSKNRCCEPIETLKYHRHPNFRVHYFWKPALNFISDLQVLNHSDLPQFMSSLQMLPCMVFIIFLPDIIQPRDEHTDEMTVLSEIPGQMFSPEKVIRRFAWSLAFLASLTLLILQVSHDFDWTYDSFTFQSSNRVRYYLERPHVTKLDEISGGILRFPAVTICNLNEFRFSQITKNDM